MTIILCTVLLMGVQTHPQDAAFRQEAVLTGDAEVALSPAPTPISPELHRTADETKSKVDVDIEVVEVVPDFRAITNVSDRKRTFFDFLAPKINAANANIRQDRKWLLSIQSQRLEESHRVRLRSLASEYKMADDLEVAILLRELMLRVDEIPVSLVLAQGATESGWGTSRFAREANNFFGIWCFSSGCGLTPLSRDAGRTHQVARFATVADGVRHYMNNINTHRAYADFRHIRATLKPSDPAGIALAEGLKHYSERGDDYVQDIKGMIRYNQLARFDP
ncbi:MAG: glucosaminidase domain-containing protein [Pseudomonadota bacterium]